MFDGEPRTTGREQGGLARDDRDRNRRFSRPMARQASPSSAIDGSVVPSTVSTVLFAPPGRTHSAKKEMHLTETEHGSLGLFGLGDQNMARHHFRHPLGKFQDVVPHPLCRDFIRGKRFVGAIEYTDADEHFRPAVQ
jgi:hypothetical protein